VPGFLDCYVLAPSRTARSAEDFLDNFLPERTQSFDSMDPAEVLGIPLISTLRDVLLFLEDHPALEYRMYWRNTQDAEPYHAHLSFNTDGTLILGLSVCDNHKPDVAEQFLRQLESFAGTGRGVLAWETPPPGNEDAFRALSKE